MAYKKKRFARRRPVVRKRRPVKKAARALRRVVKREISRMTENKTKESLNYQQTLYSTYDTTNFPTNNIFSVGPSATQLDVQQGTANGQRVGNKILIKKLTFKGSLVPLPFNATTNPTPTPMQIKLWIFYDKTAPTTQPNPLTDFFQFNSSSNAFANDLADLWAPINTDKYKVLTTRTFKLGYQQFTSAAGGSPADGYYTNNDFKLNANFSMDLTKYIPKVVRYNDNNSDPTSRHLYAMFAVTSASGGPVAIGSRMAGLQYWCQMVYEDA